MPQGFCGSGQQTPHFCSQYLGDFRKTNTLSWLPSDLPPCCLQHLLQWIMTCFSV